MPRLVRSEKGYYGSTVIVLDVAVLDEKGEPAARGSVVLGA
jgi:hypothetical protein